MAICSTASGCVCAALFFTCVATLDSKTISSVELMGAPASERFETRAGQSLDPKKLRNDVKALWRSGRFSDVRAESLEDGDSVRVVFRVQPKRPARLRRINVKPPTPGIDLAVTPGTPIDALGAHQIGAAVRKQLEASGYPFANVEASLIPAGTGQADVEVRVDQGKYIRIDNVTLAGDLGEPGTRARKALKATGSKTILPRIPGIWNGWRIRPGFSEGAVQSDAERLRSFYFARGYFDATVQTSGSRDLRFDVRAGPRYAVRQFLLQSPAGDRRIPPAADGAIPIRAACNALLDERRKAERDGVLDFQSKIEVGSIEMQANRNWADLTATVERGRAYRVGRIEFLGNHSFSDSTVRRALLLIEGEPLDEMLLRKSLARINQASLFEPLSQADVTVNTPPGSDRADLTIRLREKKMRHWYLSGPVGPMSIGGPLTLAIGSRLPAWGRHVLELSTFTASMNLMLFPKPLGSFLPGYPNKRLIPMLMIQRPPLPGQPLLSGFTISPQLGWLGMSTGYGMSQTRGLLDRLFENRHAYTPVLPVTLARQGTLYCEPQVTGFDRLRQVGGTASKVFFSFLPF